jgi:hypothetical protein
VGDVIITFILADAPSQTSQLVTFSIGGAIFALITLIFKTFSARKDKALADEKEDHDNKARLKEKAEDRQAAIDLEERQNQRLIETERRVAEAARLQKESNERVLQRSHETLGRLATIEESQAKMADQQDVLHGILNSAHTAEMKQYIVTLKTSLASLKEQLRQGRELSNWKAAGSGNAPNSDDIAAEAALQEQILYINTEISTVQDAVDDRTRSQHLAEAQVKLKNSGEIVITPVDTAPVFKAPTENIESKGGE